MTSSVAASFPLIGQLSTIINVLLFLNSLLAGAVILFAFRAVTLGDRVRKLEARLAQESEDGLQRNPDVQPGVSQPSPLSDDQPIPLARHRYGDASGLLGPGGSPDHPSA